MWEGIWPQILRPWEKKMHKGFYTLQHISWGNKPLIIFLCALLLSARRIIEILHVRVIYCICYAVALALAHHAFFSLVHTHIRFIFISIICDVRIFICHSFNSNFTAGPIRYVEYEKHYAKMKYTLKSCINIIIFLKS